MPELDKKFLATLDSLEKDITAIHIDEIHTFWSLPWRPSPDDSSTIIMGSDTQIGDLLRRVQACHEENGDYATRGTPQNARDLEVPYARGPYSIVKPLEPCEVIDEGFWREKGILRDYYVNIEYHKAEWEAKSAAKKLLSIISAAEEPIEWTELEQVFLACLRSEDDELAHLCLNRLTDRFGAKNHRIMALQGLYQEAHLC